MSRHRSPAAARKVLSIDLGNMLSSYLLIWGSWAVFGASAVGALVWAARHRQFVELDAAARSIFDAAEPEGRLSDGFPGESPPPGDEGERR